MKSKTFVIIFIALVCLSTILPISMMYIYDPLQIWHKPYFRDITFHHNMRLQAFGLIENYNFDSFILGSSMLENISSKEATEKLNARFINISLAGSDYYERKIILDYILRNRNVKKIIYSLDWYSHHTQRKGHPTYNIKTYDFLYDDNLFNNWKIYLNKKYFKCLLSFSSSKECVGSKTNIDSLNNWANIKDVNDKYGGIEKWIKYQTKDEQIKQAIEFINTKEQKLISSDRLEVELKNVKSYIDEYVISIVAKNQQTEFLFIFPPYYRAWHSINSKYNEKDFKIHLFALKYFAEQSSRYNNMKVYAFDNNDFTSDIVNYKDLGHYHYNINSYMIEHISKNQPQIRLDNVDTYISEFVFNTFQFDLYRLRNELESSF
jgi:hypothetical protein